jgi:hypothetical protein
VSGLQ